MWGKLSQQQLHSECNHTDRPCVCFCCFTSTEARRPIRDGAHRSARQPEQCVQKPPSTYKLQRQKSRPVYTQCIHVPNFSAGDSRSSEAQPEIPVPVRPSRSRQERNVSAGELHQFTSRVLHLQLTILVRTCPMSCDVYLLTVGFWCMSCDVYLLTVGFWCMSCGVYLLTVWFLVHVLWCISFNSACPVMYIF